MAEETPASINEEKLHELLGKAVTDFGAALHAPLVVIGDRLGLYKALAEHGPMNSQALAERTGTRERYVREWLASQAAGGYVTYDGESDQYHMTPEQRMVMADDQSPAFVPGAFQVAISAGQIKPRLEQAFATGEGIGWGEHEHGLFCGTERFFRPNYVNNLVNQWIPSLEGVKDKLDRGACVADVGCGFGASTVIMAQAFENSSFIGFDYHEPSMATARQRAQEAGVADRCVFQVAGAKDFPADSNGAGGYDLVTNFDCLHDMGDPVGAAAHTRQMLADDGTWMIVEPFAGDRVEENLNPIGRAFYSVSTLVCTPCSLSQEVGAGLGAQAGESRLREVVTQGGFGRFRRATQTPFNLVLEARP